MKIVITGANGQLGKELQKIIRMGKAEIGEISKSVASSEVFAADVDVLDITKLDNVRAYLNDIKPDVVINCAAFTNVDGCEENYDAAFKVNAIGPRNLAMVCEELGSKLVNVSTDYVFDGEPRETQLREYDKVEPQSVYGTTKLQGENYVREFSSKYYIVRTAWLYGYEGNNFVYTMMRLGKDKDSITVVNDQKGNPTSANDLAYHILKLIETEEYGVYHCTAKGECTWYDFAKRIMELAGLNCVVNPISTEDYIKGLNKKIAKRPAYSSLDNMMLRCTVGDEMRNWEEELETFMENIKNKGE